MPLRRQLLVTSLAIWGSLLAGLLSPSLAHARKPKRKVVWSKVVVREGPDAKRHRRYLSKVLRKEARRADWGRGKKPVRASVQIRVLRSEVKDGVLRVTCTAVGRVRGGWRAKSRFSYGGHPKERRKLERRILRLVGRGIVTRLAAIARSMPPKK